MLHIIALLCMTFGVHTISAMEPQTRYVRCINKTNQTVSVFDANGSQLLIAPHSSLSAPLYTPGNVVWMVPTALHQTMYETAITKKTSKLLFTQNASGNILCEPQLNILNWLILRTKIGAQSTASGLTFGILPCYVDEPLHIAEHEFSDTCFKLGAITSASLLAVAALAYTLRH